MTRRFHVALVVETSLAYGRRILRGITRFLRSHQPWSVFLEQRELGAAPPRWLEDWTGHGIVCRSTNPALAARFRQTGMHVVDLSDRLPNLGLPRICSDDAAIGRLAAMHLQERGFRHFAYCGFTEEEWAKRRRWAYSGALLEAGKIAAVHESRWAGPRAHPWEQEQEQIARWLQTLPRPLGVFACNDMRGQHVLDACQRVGLAVPEEVAVLGVDDDEVLCELCDPPLSSIIPNPERIGYEAAVLLDRLMNGERIDQTEVLIEPRGVTTRLSTDVQALDDPDVAAAVRYIREHACAGATMNDLLEEVPLPRPLLERKFRRLLGRSPQAEIRAVQLKRVQQLLAETDLTLERIAELAGYRRLEDLSAALQRQTGMTPVQYRKKMTAAARR